MLNFDQLPTTGGFTLPDAGWHKATITEAKMGRTQDGREKLELEYKLDSGALIKFDSIVIKTNDGKDLNFGLYKVRNLLVAVNVIPQGNFELSMLPMLIKGKKLDVKIKHEEYTKRDGSTGTSAKIDGAEFAPLGSNTSFPTQAEAATPDFDVAPVFSAEDQF